MEINEQLKLYRKRADKTQKEIADTLGIDKSTYAHYESGRRTPNAKIWVQLSKALNIPVFPAQIKIIYPDGLLDKLEECIKNNGTPTNDFKENNRRFTAINEVLQEVFDVHEQAMNTDSLPINDLLNSYEPLPKTIMEVSLDIRGEILIQRAMKCQNNLINCNIESNK